MKLIDVTNALGFTNTRPPAQPQPPAPPSEEDRKVLYAWETISRPASKNISEKAMKTWITIGIVVAVLLVAMQEFFIIIGVASVIFVKYMLTKLPPDQIRYEITNQGIRYDTEFYYWYQFKHFFITSEYGVLTAALDIVKGIPPRLFLTIKPGDEQKVNDLLKEHLTKLKQPPKSFLDNAYDSVVSKIDLEN